MSLPPAPRFFEADRCRSAAALDIISCVPTSASITERVRAGNPAVRFEYSCRWNTGRALLRRNLCEEAVDRAPTGMFREGSRKAPEALLARRAVDGTHRTNGLGAWMRAMICGVTSSHKSAEMSSQPACTASQTPPKVAPFVFDTHVDEF